MVLLLGLVVVVVTVGGAVALGATVGGNQEHAPLVELEATVDGAELTLSHRAGDSLRAGDLAVVTRSGDTTTRYELGSDGEINGQPVTSDTSYGPGDDWRPTTPLGFNESDEYLILVVHEPSSSVLYRSERSPDAVTETPPPAPTPRPTTTESPSETTSTTTATTTGTPTSTTTATPTTTPPEPESTSITGVRLNDRTTSSGGASYRLDYDVSPSTDFDRVRVTFENENQTWATQTVTNDAARGYVTYDIGSGVGDQYRITVEALDADGNVLDSESMTDVADGSDPSGNDDLSEANDPQLDGVALVDLSQEGAAYELGYTVTNGSNLSEVRVEFANRDASSTTAEYSNTNARGSITGYTAYDGTDGHDYEVTVRVFDDDGVVVDEQVITDVADGLDPASNDDLSTSSSPVFAGTAIDDLSITEADYEVSYNVTDRAEFDRVRVWISNEDQSYAEGTYSSVSPRDTVADFAVEDNGGTLGSTYRIRAQLIDDDGIVVDERIVTDTADWFDPSGNDGLSRAQSPALDSVSVSDKSNSNRNRVEYWVSYQVTGATEFAEVEVYFRNRQQPSASGVVRSSATSENRLTFSKSYGTGNTYDIEVRVVDTDGIVVDRYVISDVAGDKNS